jgi:hypothetical protein
MEHNHARGVLSLLTNADLSDLRQRTIARLDKP